MKALVEILPSVVEQIGERALVYWSLRVAETQGVERVRVLREVSGVSATLARLAGEPSATAT